MCVVHLLSKEDELSFCTFCHDFAKYRFEGIATKVYSCTDPGCYIEAGETIKEDNDEHENLQRATFNTSCQKSPEEQCTSGEMCGQECWEEEE